MSRILLYDQIVGECNEFLHKLETSSSCPGRVKMFEVGYLLNLTVLDNIFIIYSSPWQMLTGRVVSNF